MRTIQTGKQTTPREDRAHGNALFPAASYTMEWMPYELLVQCHWHDKAEFFYVLEGKTRFQIGTDYFEVQAGESVFVHGGDIHAAFPTGDAGCRFFALVFDMNVLNSFTRDIIQEEYISPFLEGRRSLPVHYTSQQPWGREVLEQLDYIRAAFDGPPGFELAVKARLYIILSIITASRLWVHRESSGSAHSGKLDRLKAVLAFIEQHYKEKITLKELASITHMSEGHFCRFFKALVHNTPVEYINSYRIKRAAELLEHEELKTLEVALEVGFDNLSYFTKKFKETTQMTPLEYRKKRNARKTAVE